MARSQLQWIATVSLLLLASTAWSLPNYLRSEQALETSLGPDAGKKTVCTATINSSNEKELFQKKLDKSKFQFVELTLVDQWAPQTDAKKEWFDRACESKIQCDVLIVSGHFGGVFFGSSGKKLTFSDLESHSCKKDCTGILSNPKEVYLFGCNTLAAKDADARTRDQYIQVLLDEVDASGAHLYTLNQAEEVAEARYGATGEENRNRMRRAFMNVPYIYGFKTKAPLGGDIAPYLSKYIDQVNPYADHLDYITAHPADNAVSAPNQIIERALKDIPHHGLYQCPGVSGLNQNDPYYQVTMNMCQFYTFLTDMDAKIRFAGQLITSNQGNLYISAIVEFLLRNPNLILNPDSNVAMKEFKSNAAIKEVFLQAFKGIVSPVMRAQWLTLGLSLDWMDQNEYQQNALAIYTQIFTHPITNETAGITCALDFTKYHGPSLEKYTVNPDAVAALIQPEHLSTALGIQAVYCSQSLMTVRVMDVLKTALQNAVASNSSQLPALISILDQAGLSANPSALAALNVIDSVCATQKNLIKPCLVAYENIDANRAIAINLAQKALAEKSTDALLALKVLIKAKKAYNGSEMDIVNVMSTTQGYGLYTFGDYFSLFPASSSVAQNAIVEKCISNMYNCIDLLSSLKNAMVDNVAYAKLIKAQQATAGLADQWTTLFNLGLNQKFTSSMITEMFSKPINSSFLINFSDALKKLMTNVSFQESIVQDSTALKNLCTTIADYSKNMNQAQRWDCMDKINTWPAWKNLSSKPLIK